MQRDEERTMSYADAMNRAYGLGLILLAGDAKGAEKVVIKSMSELQLEWNAQKHRSYYKPRENSTPKKVIVSRPTLLQHNVCENTLDYEKEQEAAFLLGQGSLDERTLTLRFVKHLLHKSRHRSFNMAVGICRVLHRYDHATTKLIYGVLDQRDQNHLVDGELGNHGDDDYRQFKMKLVNELAERFEPFVSLSSLGRNEKRFKANARSGEWYGFVQDCLTLLTPWGTEHVLPPQFEARKFNIADLKFEGKRCDDRWHRVEENRMHTVTDPDCFARVVMVCGASEPEQKVDLPEFKSGGEGEGGGPGGRLDKPPDLTFEQLRNISNELEHMGHRRKAAFEPSLTVEVDGVVRGRLKTAEANDLRLELSPDSTRIQVFTTDDEGKLLLASLWLSFLCIAPGEKWSSSLTLEGGQKLGIAFVPPVPGEAPGSYVVNVSYREGNRLRLLARRCSRFRSRLAARAPLYPRLRPAVFAARMAYYVVPIMLLCIIALAAPFHDAYRYLTTRLGVPTGEKFPEGGAPPAADTSQAGSLTCLSTLLNGGKDERAGLKEGYRIWMSTGAQGWRRTDFRADETAGNSRFKFFLDAARTPVTLKGAVWNERLLSLFGNPLRSETILERPGLIFDYRTRSLISNGPGGVMMWRVPTARGNAVWPSALIARPAAGVGLSLAASNAADFSLIHRLGPPPDLKFGRRPDGDFTLVPRVGAAYDIGSRTVLRGGYGLFYIPQENLSGANAREGLMPSSRVTFNGAERTAGTEPNVADYFFAKEMGNKAAGRTAPNLIRRTFEFASVYHFDDITREHFRPSEPVDFDLVVDSFNLFNSPQSAPGENTRVVAFAWHFGRHEENANAPRDYQTAQQFSRKISSRVGNVSADPPAAASNLETLPPRPADRREADGAKANGAEVFHHHYTFSHEIDDAGTSTNTSAHPPNRQPNVSLKANRSVVLVAVECLPGLTPDTGCEPTSTSVQLSATATDPDGDRLRPRWTTTGGRIKGEGLKATWDLSEVTPGTYSSSIEVYDRRGAVARSTFSVKVMRCACLAQSACAPVRPDDGAGRYPRGRGLEFWQEMQKQMT